MKQLELNFENKSPGSEVKKPEPISPTLFQDSLPGTNINKIDVSFRRLSKDIIERNIIIFFLLRLIMAELY